VAMMGTTTSPDPPSILYHYTRRVGLLGMLEDESIWASSAHHGGSRPVPAL